MPETLYPIHEMFYTFQGEGCNMGLPAQFIRLFGCPVHCHFCDAAGTWHKDWVPSHIERLTAQQIVARVNDHADFVVITGGEPCVYDLTQLFAALWPRETIALETSGAFPLLGVPSDTWITLSPKRAKLPLRETIARADEFKLIIEQPEDIEFFTDCLVSNGSEQSETRPYYWLHPEWSKREDVQVLQAICNAVKHKHDVVYRAGWQLHKLYKVDQQDPHSRIAAPLGGDLKKGY